MPDWDVFPKINPSDLQSRYYVELHFHQKPQNVFTEVLGFGPFEFLPITRRAPLTSLEIRTKPTAIKKSVSPNGRDRVHLAGIRIKEMSEDRFQAFWRGTETRRFRLLGGDDSAAKAKVAFAIPKSIWNRAV